MSMYVIQLCVHALLPQRPFPQVQLRDYTAETLDDPYYHRVPLPRIPGYNKLDKQARLADVHDRHASTTYAHVASNTWHAQFTSLLRSIFNTGPANYYARLQALHNPNQ